MQVENSDATPSVRWTGPEILLLFVLALLCQSLIHLMLDRVGLFCWFYGNDDLKQAMEAGDAAGRLAAYRLGLWSGVLGTIVQIGVAIAWLRLSAGVTLAELGLTLQNWRRNLLVGVLFAAIFAPGAYGIQALALLAMKSFGVAEQPHPFAQLGKVSLYPTEWGLLIGSAILLAPIWEELFYRGIVQPWVIDRQPWGGILALGAALVWVLGVRADTIQRTLAAGGWDLFLESIPILSLLVLAGIYSLLSSSLSPAALGLIATAILFAWIHARVWPSPLPLVWLALGLGWLRWRSGSLIGCFALHSVFNAIATAILLWNLYKKA